jgi:D-inositol-3-phosphate glycosyltransferase
VSVGHVDHPPAGTSFRDGEIVLSGWAVFADGPTAKVEVWLGDSPLGRARLGLSRPDVGAAHPGPDAGVAGFELRAGLEDYDGSAAAELRVLATSVKGERLELGPIPVSVEAPAPAAPPDTAARHRLARADGEGRRVLAFTNVLTLGGASLYFYEVLREAKRQGRVEPTVVTAIDGPIRADFEALGVPVHVLSSVPLHDLDAYRDRLDELAAWAGPGEFELCFVNTATGLTLPGADLAARLGIPAVWAIHESFPAAQLWQGMAPELRARGEAALGEAAFAVFAAEATRAMYRRALAERSAAIPYGLDLEPIEAAREGFDRRETRRRGAVPADAELVICVGTVEPRKGQVPLAQAFDLLGAKHPKAELAFVGAVEGPDADALAARIAASPHAQRMRIVPRTREVQSWYGMADLLVCASDVESLPKTVLEAMAWELPVVATSVFGLPEAIEHGVDGWLCEPGDVSSLAACLDAALKADEATRRRIGAAARETILRRHDLGTYAGRLSDVFDRAVSGA